MTTVSVKLTGWSAPTTLTLRVKLLFRRVTVLPITLSGETVFRTSMSLLVKSKSSPSEMLATTLYPTEMRSTQTVWNIFEGLKVHRVAIMLRMRTRSSCRTLASISMGTFRMRSASEMSLLAMFLVGGCVCNKYFEITQLPSHVSAVFYAQKKKFVVLFQFVIRKTNKMEINKNDKRPLAQSGVPHRIVRIKQQARKKKSGEQDEPQNKDMINKFKDFLLFKAFDIISEGSYRRFALKQKHSGDQWAIDLYTSSQSISLGLKNTMKQIHRMQFSPATSKLHKLCLRVVQDLNPPTMSLDVWKICSLTGMRTDKIISIGKSSKGDVCFVHQKFLDFFSRLWFLARIDICIKQFTTLWCNVRADKSLKQTDYKSLCEQLREDTDFVDAFCQYFMTSMDHVEQSLIQHISYCSEHTILHSTIT